MYERNEAFRYSFADTLLPCTFEILEINGIAQSSHVGSGHIIDISLSGAKFLTELYIPINKAITFKIKLVFKLMDYDFAIPAMLMWVSKKDNHNEYGCNLITDEETEKKILEKLKQYSRHKQGLT